ncbi:MAG: dihydropteroate synthase [Actinobacteria bacterium]|nr:dihydropteroate synthase [Actinomycetota bacterium]
MGILNVTPDSFSDGGRFLDPAAAVARGRELIAEGAAVVDVGGESTRPGARPVDETTELARVLPVIEALASQVRVSIDTTKPVVARAAAAAGASLINDVSASLHDVAAETGVGWIAMHMRGDPRTMQESPRYDDVVGEVVAFLAERAERARLAGVSEVWIDPGIGFGKTTQHNLSLLKNLPRIVGQGWPVVIGTSRKGFLGTILARSDGQPEPTGVGDRLEGSLTTATWALTCGVGMVRAHDVAAAVEAVRVVAGSSPIGAPAA